MCENTQKLARCGVWSNQWKAGALYGEKGDVMIMKENGRMGHEVSKKAATGVRFFFSLSLFCQSKNEE